MLLIVLPLRLGAVGTIVTLSLTKVRRMNIGRLALTFVILIWLRIMGWNLAS